MLQYPTRAGKERNKLILASIFHMVLSGTITLMIHTGKPLRSEYFLAGLNEGGASIELSAKTTNVNHPEKQLIFYYLHMYFRSIMDIDLA